MSWILLSKKRMSEYVCIRAYTRLSGTFFSIIIFDIYIYPKIGIVMVRMVSKRELRILSQR